MVLGSALGVHCTVCWLVLAVGVGHVWLVTDCTGVW